MWTKWSKSGWGAFILHIYDKISSNRPEINRDNKPKILEKKQILLITKLLLININTQAQYKTYLTIILLSVTKINHLKCTITIYWTYSHSQMLFRYLHATLDRVRSPHLGYILRRMRVIYFMFIRVHARKSKRLRTNWGNWYQWEKLNNIR